MQKFLVLPKWHKSFLSIFVFLAISLLHLATAYPAKAEANDPAVEKIEGKLALRQPIKVKIKNINPWIKQAGSDFSKVILYIDGVAVKFKNHKPGLTQNNTLLFDLQRDEENKEAWATILGRKGDNPGDDFCRRSVEVTVGIENEPPIQTEVKQLPLVRVDESWVNPFLATGLAFLILFLVLAVKSDIIRDTGDQPGNTQRKMYSLARTQMALWTFFVIIAYVFIWMVTSDISSLTPGIIGLMGISAVTGLGSAAIDSSKKSENNNKRQVQSDAKTSCMIDAEKLNAEISSLMTTINTAPSPINPEEQKITLSTKQAELAAKKKDIEDAEKIIQVLDKKLTPQPSTGNFFKDILNDDNGVSLHRFQILIWTVVLIFIFIGRVIDTLTMPEFDTTLLALMGISGATYIGFKLPDQQG
jgi:hypothetical protein